MRGARARGREAARAAVVVVLLTLISCNPTSQRPDLVPLPQAIPIEVRYRRDAATERLVRRLREDSIPLAHVAYKDGYLESPWMDAATLQPTKQTPLGPDVVRLRGWVDPARIGFSFVTVEVSYRAAFDPSLPERELDRMVPEDHPARKRVDAVLEKVKIYERQ